MAKAIEQWRSLKHPEKGSSADNSIVRYPDGSYYDFGRGGCYYQDTNELLLNRPDVDPDKIGMAKSKGGDHNTQEVTKAFQKAKENSALAYSLASDYIPFFDYEKCGFNIGVKNNKLAVGFYASDSSGFNFVQYRANTRRAKWMSFKGSTSKGYEKRINGDGDVYITFGMGDFLTLKSTSLNYVCFGGDNAVKNNPYAKEISSAIGDRRVIVFQDNDPSGEVTVDNVKEMLERDVHYVVHPEEFKAKGDIRDLAFEFDDQEAFITALKAYHIQSTKKPLKDAYGQFLVPYDGYIAKNEYLDIKNMMRGVIYALTGAGKTYSFSNVAGTLILLPRREGTTIESGEDTDFLLDAVFDQGGTITWDKFYGHMKNEEFRRFIESGKIRLVVDESHLLIADGSFRNDMHEMIYNLDAVFLSGTLIHQFRPDLEHFKFIPEEKRVIYTSSVIPDLAPSLIFVENTRVLMQNYPNNCVVSRSHNFSNYDYMNYKAGDGHILATSCMREAVGIRNTALKCAIVVRSMCQIWSVSDCIQGVGRLRDPDAVRVIVGEVKNDVVNNHKISYWRDRLDQIIDEASINAASGESHSKILKYMLSANKYMKPSEHSMVCFINSKLRDWYDHDFYEFKPLDLPFDQTIEINTELDDEIDTPDVELFTEEWRGITYAFPKTEHRKFMEYVPLYESGAVAKFCKLGGEVNLKEYYTHNNFAKSLKIQYNKERRAKNKKLKSKGKDPDLFTQSKLIDMMRQSCQVEIRYKGKVVQRVSKNHYQDPDNLTVKVVGDTPFDFSEFVAKKQSFKRLKIG